MFLICGIGNIGAQYKNTRHNIGFELIDAMISKYEFSSPKDRFNSIYCEGKLHEEKIHLIKPKTFVNLTGESIIQWKNFYKIPNENIFVIHDDISLESGKIKIVFDSGDGGHNGVKSVTSKIGKNYFRIKIGCGNDFTNNKENLASFVLGKIPKTDEEKITQAINIIIENLSLVLLRTPDSFSKLISLNKIKQTN